MAKTRQVAILVPLERAHLTRLLRGVHDYAQEHGGWSFHVNPELPGTAIRLLEGWDGDGALALVDRPADAKIARQLNLPIVNLSAAMKAPGLARVTVDHRAVGRLAAEHLLERGFRRFAYYGLRGVWFSQQRGQGFCAAVARHGYECATMQDTTASAKGRAWQESDERLQSWLRELEPPVGLLAAYDYRASMVIESCKRIGLRVPDDLAVVGVNNDTVVCDFCSVPISSVSRNDWRVGYEAAGLLDRLMRRRKGKAATDEILVPPDRVVLRRSSDVLAIDDKLIEIVVQHIRENLASDFSIDELTRLVPLSRRWLQHRFKQSLEMTVHQFICRTRVDRAKQLLLGKSKMGLSEIAEECGFSETRQMRKVFERLEDTTPARFRSDQPVHPGDAHRDQP